MLAMVYQPGKKKWALLVLYFFKEMVRQPANFTKAFGWALRERRKRTLWLRQWLRDHRPNLPHRKSLKLSPNAAGSACPR
jgi:hypothetical protein